MAAANVREAIEQEIEKVRSSIADMKAMTGPVSPDDAIGRISRMDAINNQSITDAALRHAESKLEQLERMRLRVDEPAFGRCVRCGKGIPVQRMLLMPHSDRCVRCAS
ncbi:MAG: TraR/DksA C4-type zinc finger protein [Flavobacteriales bacterium]|nr:TraR/DksA C4-type zinc finger protein [Flavobacteriales bacterium]